MADSDKNATNYWCKYCKTFVRNSPLERRNHESSPRHEGSLKRFLKELHKTNEREGREKQRAKDEVARLNGLKPGSDASPASRPSNADRDAGSSSKTGPRPPARQASREERKQQMAQLAAMGVVVPEEFRKENAMAGEWETVSVESKRQPSNSLPRLKGEDQERGDLEPHVGSQGGQVKKRKLEDDDLDTGGATKGKRQPNWGSDVRNFKDTEMDEDLDALLAGSASAITRKVKHEDADAPNAPEASIPRIQRDAESGDAKVKKESSLEPDSQIETTDAKKTVGKPNSADDDDGAADIGSMFKKRKKKALRQD